MDDQRHLRSATDAVSKCAQQASHKTPSANRAQVNPVGRQDESTIARISSAIMCSPPSVVPSRNHLGVCGCGCWLTQSRSCCLYACECEGASITIETLKPFEIPKADERAAPATCAHTHHTACLLTNSPNIARNTAPDRPTGQSPADRSIDQLIDRNRHGRRRQQANGGVLIQPRRGALARGPENLQRPLLRRLVARSVRACPSIAAFMRIAESSFRRNKSNPANPSPV